MKIAKLVVGIILIVLSPFIVFQSIAALFVSTVSKNGSASGPAGVLMAFAFLVSGIVYIVTHNSTKLGGDIANAIILVLFGAIAMFSAGNTFGDLIIWIWIGFIIGLGFLIWHYILHLSAKKKTPQRPNYNQNNYYQSEPTRMQTRSARHHR
ncbi:hypothetical protein [Companilactobacillus keshanensis]|uniref:Uncharacterized protein n=1 Tax=Companilactobacillus keshanensis TaxID=2486003 RepID=A0ABW4BWW2_9LACO|nr:hypothetical protein [Companilactobacillus keshanensis]